MYESKSENGDKNSLEQHDVRGWNSISHTSYLSTRKVNKLNKVITRRRAPAVGCCTAHVLCTRKNKNQTQNKNTQFGDDIKELQHIKYNLF